MADGPKVCIDRVLDPAQFIEAADRALAENPENVPMASVHPGFGVAPPTRFEMAGLTGKKWQNGRRLRVRFLDGDPSVQTKVEANAKRWEAHANITFDFGADPAAEIRISFAQPGSWSYVGTDALTIPTAQPTMNFGWLTPATDDAEYERVVAHEFGHALFCIHEHQHPGAAIPWDKSAVYAYYEGPPNTWTKEQVDHNLFARYSTTVTQFSAFDPKSIMLYPVPNAHTVGDFEIGWNRTLSENDKSFVGVAYPGQPQPILEIVVDGQATEAAIGQAGEQDAFQFDVPARHLYRIETQGTTDVVTALLGPDDRTLLVAQDDDSGSATNARIDAALERGTYYLNIRHHRSSGTGSYRVAVRTLGQ